MGVVSIASRLYTVGIMADITGRIFYQDMLAMKKRAVQSTVIQEPAPVMTAIAEGINRFTFRLVGGSIGNSILLSENWCPS